MPELILFQKKTREEDGEYVVISENNLGKDEIEEHCLPGYECKEQVNFIGEVWQFPLEVPLMFQ